jgi:hypothetical protein
MAAGKFFPERICPCRSQRILPENWRQGYCTGCQVCSLPEKTRATAVEKKEGQLALPL